MDHGPGRATLSRFKEPVFSVISVQKHGSISLIYTSRHIIGAPRCAEIFQAARERLGHPSSKLEAQRDQSTSAYLQFEIDIRPSDYRCVTYAIHRRKVARVMGHRTFTIARPLLTLSGAMARFAVFIRASSE
jgi:hypothetical protein